MNGAPIENGAVAIAGDKITDVGSFAAVATRNTGEIVDLGEQILLPGLINAHCHLDYTCLRGKIAPPKSFADWIRAINAEKATLSPDDYVDSIQRGFEEARRFGTTTIANLTAFPELIVRTTPPIRICTSRSCTRSSPEIARPRTRASRRCSRAAGTAVHGWTS